MQQNNPTQPAANETTNTNIPTILPPIEVVNEATLNPVQPDPDPTLNPVQPDPDPTATTTLNATRWPEETQLRNSYTKSTVKVLSAICKTRGLPTSARLKENYIERLLNHDYQQYLVSQGHPPQPPQTPSRRNRNPSCMHETPWQTRNQTRQTPSRRLRNPSLMPQTP